MPAKTDHFDGQHFFNPWTGTKGPALTDVAKMLLEHKTPWPERIDDPPVRPPALGDAAAVLTFIGHATFLIQTAAGNILTDPVCPARQPMLCRPAARRQPRDSATYAISVMLLSHGRYDHCDGDASQLAGLTRSS